MGGGKKRIGPGVGALMRGKPCGISFIKSKNKRADKQHGAQVQEPGARRGLALALGKLPCLVPIRASTHDVEGSTPATGWLLRLQLPPFPVRRISFILVSHFFARPAYLMVYPPLRHSTTSSLLQLLRCDPLQMCCQSWSWS